MAPLNPALPYDRPRKHRPVGPWIRRTQGGHASALCEKEEVNPLKSASGRNSADSTQRRYQLETHPASRSTSPNSGNSVVQWVSGRSTARPNTEIVMAVAAKPSPARRLSGCSSGPFSERPVLKGGGDGRVGRLGFRMASLILFESGVLSAISSFGGLLTIRPKNDSLNIWRSVRRPSAKNNRGSNGSDK